MFERVVKTFLVLLVHFYTISSVAENIGQLPYCLENSAQGLLIVSTLDGKLSALNSSGEVLWQRDTDPGPLVKSNIHNIELTSNGEWIRLIPSLTGGLYKFNGKTIDAIPISADNLLKSSFFYSHDLVIAGGKEIRTYGVGLHSGNLLYTCSLQGCQNETTFEGEIDNVLVIERNTLTVRAHEPRTGNERWNFSVGHHNIVIPSINCLKIDNSIINFNVTAILPEGLLIATKLNDKNEILWKYKFDAPIVNVWMWDGRDLSVVDVFDIPVEEDVKIDSSPSIYLAMHNKQLYIHESYEMLNMIQAKMYLGVEAIGRESVAKIPWKPIPASSSAMIKATDHEIAARSVLYNSEYVNGNGYYLYVEGDMDIKNNLICSDNATSKAFKDAVSIMGSLHNNWAYAVLFVIAGATVYLMFGPKAVFIPQEKVTPSNSVDLGRSVSSSSDGMEEKFVSNYEQTFETISCLGKGGFGVVFEAKQKIDECSYAIKRISLPKGDSKSQDHVVREVKALAQLENKNIVRYYNSWFERPPIGWKYRCDEMYDCRQDDEIDSAVVSSSSNDATSKQKHKRQNSTIIDMPMMSHSDVDLIPRHNNYMNDSDIIFASYTNSAGGNTSNSVSFRKDTPSQSVSMSCAEDDVDEEEEEKVVTPEIDQPQRSKCDGPIYLFIQMQLCKRESLRDWLFNNTSRDRCMILPIFKQILNAVEYIHSKGLIHRDLKPNNIFFSMDNDIKVGDFGLVTTMSDKDGESNASITLLQNRTNDAGTELYMSPEQLEKKRYNLKVDIYSLGMILFELLVPFKTEQERWKTLKALRCHSYPEGFDLNFPDEYRLLNKMLSDNPDVRPVTADIKKTPPFIPTC